MNLCFSGESMRSRWKSINGTEPLWRTLWMTLPRRSAFILKVRHTQDVGVLTLQSESVINNPSVYWFVWPSGAAGEIRLRGELQAGGWSSVDLYGFLSVRHAGSGLGLPAPLPRVQTSPRLLRHLISFTSSRGQEVHLRPLGLVSGGLFETSCGSRADDVKSF